MTGGTEIAVAPADCKVTVLEGTGWEKTDEKLR